MLNFLYLKGSNIKRRLIILKKVNLTLVYKEMSSNLTWESEKTK